MYGYGVLGGVLAGTADFAALQSYANTCYAAHRGRRDFLTTSLDRVGATPVPAAPAYTLPFRVVGQADCLALARHIESRTAAVYAAAVASTTDSWRALAIDALTDCAIREVAWGAPAPALPGIKRL